jgi:hypothetical protein
MVNLYNSYQLKCRSIRDNLKGVYPISKYDLDEKVGDGTFG